MSISKIAQCLQMFSELTLDIGDLNKHNLPKTLLWILKQGYVYWLTEHKHSPKIIDIQTSPWDWNVQICLPDPFKKAGQ